ncbi:glutathione hydrolase 5 proenzyme isoform X3 [Sagmatias obliquidens]|uniref:glutathione hydrolase 5 proenzyme isoform X3 n=1 Tax=Sagmatias obliquidens TaxID=3371155 RepID=UPI000F4432C2|nr:glutathione hydrolase 5 proenzyme isoform X3 [Lagenorhynchus obliquidens]
MKRRKNSPQTPCCLASCQGQDGLKTGSPGGWPAPPLRAMAQGHGATVSMVLLGLGLALAIIVPIVVVSWHRVHCGPQAFAHAAVAADSKICSDIGRAILQQHGSPVDATIAALVCTGVVNPQSMGLGGGVIFTIYNASTGKVEVINARETVPASHVPGLLDQCKQAQPLGTGAQWIGVPGELRGYAEAHHRHGHLPWAQLFRPTIALLRGGLRVPRILSRFLHSSYLRPSLHASSLRQLFFNGTEPLSPHDPLPWPALAATLETVAAEGAEALYTGRLGQMLLEDVAKEGSLLTPQDLASFRPEVVDALEMPLGDYTLYSPPPPAGGAILSFVLNVLKGFNFSAESVARPEGRVNLYHHLVETLKFARGQRWRLWDPRSHPEVQNASQDLLGEALAQHIHQQIDTRGDHQLSHYSLAETWSHRMGTAHVSVLGEDGSAVSATSTINTPFGAMVYSPRTGILLNNELLDLCWRHRRGSGVTPPPVPGERPPSSMVPSILVNAAQGSKLVIGGAGGELIISAVAQAIMNKLWLGLDLQAAIAAPILHVDSKGRVEYEPSFSQDLNSENLDLTAWNPENPEPTALSSLEGGEEGAPVPGPEPDREARFPERGPGRVPGRGLRVRRSGPQEGWGALRLLKRLLPPQSWDPTQQTSRLAWSGRIWTPWLDGQPGASRGGDSPADGRLWGLSPALPEPLWPCPDPSNLPRPLTQDWAPTPRNPIPHLCIFQSKIKEKAAPRLIQGRGGEGTFRKHVQ